MFCRAAIPNFLCYLRVVLSALAVLLWYLLPISTAYSCLLPLFIAASLSDWLDGVLARRWAVQSAYGATLDQITDKICVCSFLIMLLDDEYISSIPAIIIIAREITVSGMREYLAGQGRPMPVARAGKWKTALQMLGMILVLLGVVAIQMLGTPDAPYARAAYVAYQSGRYIVWLAALAAVYSALEYVIRAKASRVSGAESH